jgi:hypothetical protein
MHAAAIILDIVRLSKRVAEKTTNVHVRHINRDLNFSPLPLRWMRMFVLMQKLIETSAKKPATTLRYRPLSPD